MITIDSYDVRSELVPSVDALVCPVVVRHFGLRGALLREYNTIVTDGVYVPELKANVFHANRAQDLIARFTMNKILSELVQVSDRAEALVAEQLSLSAESEAALQAWCVEGLKPRPFQKIGIKWLMTRNRALLLDDMGLGKTLQALMAVPRGSPLVIVAPAVAKGVWRREIRKWRRDYSIVRIIEGMGNFEWPAAGRVVIVNKDILPDNLPEEGAEPGTVVIVDEIQDFKNHLSIRHLRLSALLKQPNVSKVYGLTATPMPNRPIEMWNLLHLLDLHVEAFGTISQFRAAFNKGTAHNNLSRVALRRQKSEVLHELPDKTRSFVEVDVNLTRSEQFIIEEAEEALWEYGSSVPFELIAKARAITAKAKGPAAIERVEEYESAGTPLLVFSCHREAVDKIGARPGWGLITGDTSHAERTAIEDAFQAGKLIGVAGTMQAMGVSITLTRASHILVIDRYWNPAINMQAEDRAYRMGQKNAVTVEVLIAKGTIDERVEEIIEEKAELISSSIDRITDVPLNG